MIELQPVEIEAEVEAMTQGGEFDEIRGVHKIADNDRYRIGRIE